jgi:hypothetical protein
MEGTAGSPKLPYLDFTLGEKMDSFSADTEQSKMQIESDDVEDFSVFDLSPRNEAIPDDDDEQSKIVTENKNTDEVSNLDSVVGDTENLVDGKQVKNKFCISTPIDICYPPGGRDALDLLYEQRVIQKIIASSLIAKNEINAKK